MPLSYKAWVAAEDPEALAEITDNLVRLTARLIEVEAATGKLIHLDLEPEPDGLLERSREVVDFFRDWLLPRGAPRLAQAAGLSRDEARPPPAPAPAGLPGHLPPGGGLRGAGRGP